jgi:hypothetical protein
VLYGKAKEYSQNFKRLKLKIHTGLNVEYFRIKLDVENNWEPTELESDLVI